MQSVLILKTAEFPPRLGLVQVGMTEKSSRNPDYLSRGGCGAGNLTFLIVFLPETKLGRINEMPRRAREKLNKP